MSTSTPKKAHELLAMFDAKLRKEYGDFICGVDEAGRGSWAGPIVAAACILPADVRLEGLNDSKQMSETMRESLLDQIKSVALAFDIVAVEAVDIDRYGIDACNIKAMVESAKNATNKNGGQASLYVVDQSPGFTLQPYRMMSKADATSLCVAAASVLAKTFRDNLMKEYAKDYPGYFWEDNKGYINEQHRQGVLSIGLTKLHRKSYKVTGVTKPKQITFDDMF